MEAPQSLSLEKKHWWIMNRKIVSKHIRDARSLIATQDANGVSAAIAILDGALAFSPRLEIALELKARSLLFLRRFRDVADMLQDYIPSNRGGSAAAAAAGDDSSTSLSSGGSGRAFSDSREGAKLLPKCEDGGERGLRCFSIYDIKRKLVAGIHRAAGGEREGQWRYLILGQACCHLGLLEDAMILLQTGRRLASAAFRRQSITHSDDIFNFSPTISKSNLNSISSAPNPLSESESASNLLNHIKLLLRRRSAAISSLDAGHPIEAARHFSKILENRRGTPHPFAATCLIGRAAAYRDAGRIAEAIADCNRALAIDPTSIPALRTRADLLESVRCLTDCLRDLDNLKLLYDTIFRDRKLPGPVWRRPFHDEVRYRDIPNCLRSLTARINGIRQRFAAGEGNDVDYYKLIGVRRGCSRSELERANLLLLLRHKPDKAGAFVDKLEFSDEYWDLDAVRDQARMSALILYRMLQKGYSCIMATIMEEEAEERKRVAVVAVPAVYQGVFCRDMATVGSMLSRVISVKYEGLSC